MPCIEVEKGVHLYVEDWGKGNPVVFIHGWPLTYKCFEYQFTQLPKHGVRCIGIDLRGYGQSDKPWGNYNYDVFADDILKVLTAMNLSDVTMVGHSMGCAITLNYLLRHDHKHVSRAILLAPATPSFSAQGNYTHGFSKETCNAFLDLCYEDRPKLLVEFGKIFFETENSVSPKMADWFHYLGMQASAHATAQCIEALRDVNLGDQLGKINIPVHMLHGDNDRVCPYELSKSLHAEIKDSHLITYPNSGHGLFYEDHEKVNDDILRIVREG